MQIGIDSFVATNADPVTGVAPGPGQRIGDLLEEIALADQVGLDVFGIGEHHRFKPLIDLYRQAGAKAGHAPDKLRVGLHCLGYVADTNQRAADEFFPGYAQAFTAIGRERGWPPVTRAQFDALLGPTGALHVGDPATVAGKIRRTAAALGGIDRFSFQMSVASLPHARLMHAIGLLGTQVAPALRKLVI